MSTAVAPPEAPKPVSPSHSVQEPKQSALGFVRPLAVFAVIAMVLGRVIGPSMRGLVVGYGRLGELLELAGAIASQLFLILATVGSLALGIASWRLVVPTYVRFVLFACGGLVVLVTLSASASRLPPFSLLLIGGAAGLLALVVAVDAMRTPFARGASLVFGLCGAGAILRVGALSIATREGNVEKLMGFARSVSTAGIILEALAIAVALGVVASQSRKLTSPSTFVALAVAMVGTRFALIGSSEESGSWSVLLFRAAKALVLRPEPLLSPTMVTFIAFAAPTVACAALATRSLTPALCASIALALLARGGADVPLCALSLALGSVTLVLASRDHRGLWAEIARDENASAPPAKTGKTQSS